MITRDDDDADDDNNDDADDDDDNNNDDNHDDDNDNKDDDDNNNNTLDLILVNDHKIQNIKKNTLDLILLLILAGIYCCCCCCYCCYSFCQPIELVNKAKIYTVINPPGVLFEEGTEKHHEPTAEEIQAYRKLLSQIRKL
jgi:hypothetical protein